MQVQRLRMVCLIAGTAALLAAAEPVWKTNQPVASWTENDARQVLQNSPWSKMVVAGITRRETEDERREGGNMGQPHGVGYDGIDERRTRPNLGNLLGQGASPSTVTLPTIKLLVRWESAFPVRAAELKMHEDLPTTSDDGYTIAVYGVPITEVKRDPKTVGDAYKGLAFLRREGKKDVKPMSAEVFTLEHVIVVVYKFPMSAEITKKDGKIEFSALIGRLQATQEFDVGDMDFLGKLEL